MSFGDFNWSLGSNNPDGFTIYGDRVSDEEVKNKLKITLSTKMSKGITFFNIDFSKTFINGNVSLHCTGTNIKEIIKNIKKITRLVLK